MIRSLCSDLPFPSHLRTTPAPAQQEQSPKSTFQCEGRQSIAHTLQSSPKREVEQKEVHGVEVDLRGEHTIACGLCSSIRALWAAVLTRRCYWILCGHCTCQCWKIWEYV